MDKDQKNGTSILAESAQKVLELLGEEVKTISVERVVLGLFFTGVSLSDGSGGICFTPIKMIPDAVCCPSSAKAMPNSGRMRGKPAVELLDDLDSENPLKKTIAIAGLNALTERCWRRGLMNEFELIMDADPLDDVEIPAGSFTVIVGALLPYIKMLKKNQLDYAILELDPRTLREEELPHFVPVERQSDVIPKANFLLITGTTLLTDSLEAILALCKPSAEVIVVGPTASIHPQALFERGATRLGGIRVSDADGLLDILCEGGSGYHFYGKFAHKSVIRCKKSS